MAMVKHNNGDQLSNTRLKAQLNFVETIALHVEVTAGDLVVIRSGMGLPEFRDACRANLTFIYGAIIGLSNPPVIDDGDMLWDVRDKLQVAFTAIAVA